VKSFSELRERPERERRELGYHDTLREILQQPATAALVRERGISLASTEGPILLTGSGSSHYIGESLEPILAKSLARPVRAVPAGALLTDLPSHIFGRAPGTLVSFARSGDSPESSGVVDLFLERVPSLRHVLVTCNREGALATRYRDRDNVATIVLAERTNDRSLVMTSSFTNLWLAGRILGCSSPDVDALAHRAEAIFERDAEAIFEAGARAFGNAIYLGSGPRYGAAREAALKMLEMTDGNVPTFAESFLGLRHGPMCALKESSLLVGFLSAEEPHHSYERDLLKELSEKNVRPQLLLAGPGGEIDWSVPDDDAALLDVVVGQLLGLFRSLSLGLHPDAPSATGVISRVVRRFDIH
jgi:tagatose-6-phosphate ketose/aldose isomerase